MTVNRRDGETAVHGPSDEPLEPQEVARAYRAGSPGAVAVVRRRVRTILGFRGYRIPVEDRRDLEQQVMAQLWQAVSGGGARTDGFWGLVEVVTARRCIDWLRTRKSTVTLDMDPVDVLQDPHGRFEDRERQRLARSALESLPQPCRKLIYLHAGQGMTYGQISTLMGKSEGALRVQMHRCLERARRALAGLTGSDAGERETF